MGNESSKMSTGAAGTLQPERLPQKTCHGCERIEVLLTHYAAQPELRRAKFRRRIIAIHSSFDELDRCAKRCPSCRVFRQALLLNCTTTHEANHFAHEAPNSPVYVTFARRLDGSSTPEARTDSSRPAEVRIPQLGSGGQFPVVTKPAVIAPDIIIEIPGLETSESMRIACYESKPYKIFALHPNPLATSVRQQIRQWIQACEEQHTGICSNLAWSSQNPTRLVQITEEGRLRLIDAPQNGDRLRYVALSYCWGTPTNNGDGNDVKRALTDGAVIEASMTRLQNLAHRHERIGAVELPATIADALRLLHGLGISYMWVDSLCIVQDSPADWSRESARMHEYYGNAHFTLCVMSNARATEPLAQPRQAWTRGGGSGQCRLNALWLDINTDLHQMRRASPLAKRAWTLQEEQLSPRILYWTAQQFFWSCACDENGEELVNGTDVTAAGLTGTSALGDDFTVAAAKERPSDHAQAFLVSLRAANNVGDLHSRWLSLLESYTRRSLTQRTDTFPALAGLAARYGNANQDDKYIAGLWRNSFAQGLAWSITTPNGTPTAADTDDKRDDNDIKDRINDDGTASKRQTHIAPTWSWASLSPNTPTKMLRSLTPAPDFSLLTAAPDPTLLSDSNSRSATTNLATDASDHITSGALIRKVHVRGRLRPLWTEGAVLVPWSGVCLDVSGRSEFSFSAMPQQDMYAVDLPTARLVAYEARREEVLVQLDYREKAEQVAARRARLWALEIGEGIMLLLEEMGGGEGEGDVNGRENGKAEERRYQRVGMKQGYRHNFFDRAVVERIVLE